MRRALVPWLGIALFFLIGIAALPIGESEAARPPRATRTPTATPIPSGGGGGVAAAAASRRNYIPINARDSTPTPAPRSSMAVGVNMHNSNFARLQEMGFPWVKLYADWAADPSGAGAENLVNQARAVNPNIKILLRIDNTPGSARTYNQDDPINEAAFRAYLGSLVGRLKGKVHAYELFNEPNLKWEWQTYISGNASLPSVRGYVRVVQIGGSAIKAKDPAALVITGGLSSAGNGGPESIGDINFIHQMYDNGLHNAQFDGIGIHPYGGPFTWDQGVGDPGGVYFKRAEEQRAAMVAKGDSGRKTWATEFGWLISPSHYGYSSYGGVDCIAGLGGRASWTRHPDDVANQLYEAHRHAAENWPWMGGMFMFNFDFSSADWVKNDAHKTCDAPTWYSIVSNNNFPNRPATEPAFTRLQQFAREWLGAR